MAFLNPTLLAVGLACVAVPIAIHILMRRRRRPVPWAAMRFLLEAYRRQQRRARLEQVLLLAARCLLVAALAVALGRPALTAAGLIASAGARTVILVVDNSIASQVASGNGTELDGLKARAEDLLKGLSTPRGDVAGLIAAAGPAAGVVIPPSGDLAGVMDAVRHLPPAESAADLPGALALARQAAAEAQGGATVVLLSPWRAGTVDPARPLPPLDLPERARVVASAPAENAVGNTTVLDATPTRSVLIAPEGPGGGAGSPAVPAQVRVQLRRSGALPAGTAVVEVRAVALSGAASPPATVPVAWSAGQSLAAAAVNLEIPPDLVRQGPALAFMARVRGDALAADDVFVRPVQARRQVRVALVAPRSAPNARPDQFAPAEWLALALAPTATALDRRGAEVEVAAVDPGAAGAAGDVLGADAVFVAAPDRVDAAMVQSLRRLLDSGRLIVLMPPADGAASAAWADRLVAGLDLPFTLARETRALESATLADPGSGSGPLALLGPELPELVKPVRVMRVLPAQGPAEKARTLLALSDGTPLVLATAPSAARGLVVYLAAAPELTWTNLPAMPLMVPLVQEVLRQGLGESGASGAAVAGRAVEWPRGVEQYRRIDLPEVAAGSADPAPPAVPSRAGLFRTTDASSRTVGMLAVNADGEAARVEAVPRADVERWLSGVAGPGRFAWLDGATAGGGGGGGGGSVAAVEERSTPFDVPLLGLAAALAVVEMLLARRFSHASVAGRTPGLSASLPAGGGIVAPARAGEGAA